MHARNWQVPTRVLGALVATLLAACSNETSTEPDAAVLSHESASLTQASRSGAVELGSCDSLAVGHRNQLLAHYYAKGSQIYFWDGQAWLFIGPDAVLYADKRARVEVGVHQIAGVWESRSGSKVVGLVERACTPNASAIPWQLLSALGHTGRGIFARVDWIQRIRTGGGLAPTTPGTEYGQQQRVDYTAEYLFYRNRR